jgi:hypothetical protein
MKVEPSTERVGEETKTTKKQPATTTPEVVPPKPSGTTTPTPPKTTEAPSVPPKAVEAPSVPPKAVEEIATQTVQRTPKAISGTLKYGFLTAAGLSAVVSAHEGNPNSVYGDYKDNNKLKNKYGERPEEWSKKNLGTEKKLTDFTMSELLEYQKYRNKTKASTGAVGIAGFMPSTLFGKNLDGKNGLFSKSGLSWNDKFSEDNQKLLQAVLNEQDDKILSAGLTKLGINQITPGIKIASNYVGAQGVLWVIEEGQKDPNITVAEALKKHTGRDVTAGGINQDLNTIKAKDFVAIKEEFALNKAKKLGLIDNQNNTSGDAVNNSSKTNRELKNTNKSSPGNITVLNNNTTTVNGSNIYESPKDNKNTSPFIDKQYGQ